ncbi:MAG TPA: nickel-binding protein [Candidatus Polarisedimenticolaceae bacterium]|nr:nickel-binding protein [Candidatus Polarisedimenticolaceae bacterium]
MPLYMDIHVIPGAKPEDVAKAHMADMDAQKEHGVEYVKYWFNESCGKIFCLCEAPSAEAAAEVHKKAHGLVAERIIEVQPEIAEGFMGGVEANLVGAAIVPGGGQNDRDSGMRTILFTDIVNSTSLTQKLGDRKAMELLRVHDRIVREALAQSAGREVKHTGDGIMASFISAAATVRCAAKIQSELDRHRAEHDGFPLQVRIGAAAGEPVEENKDLFGSTVQLAARLCAHADPDHILVSHAVVELCLGKGVPFQDLGEVSLRGFEQPIRVHTVSWADTTVA